MPFSLKNAKATYQRAINLTFHDMIDDFMEVYINDVIVKFDQVGHLNCLEQTFIRM